MEKSPLVRLPKELRDYIYELVLTCPGDINIQLQHPPGERPSRLHKNLQFRDSLRVRSVSYTCRQARHESEALFYSLNSFVTAAGPEISIEETALNFEEGIDQTLKTIQALATFFEARSVKQVQGVTIQYGISFDFLYVIYTWEPSKSSRQIFDQIHGAALGTYGPALLGAVFDVQIPFDCGMDSYSAFVRIDTARMLESCAEARRKIIEEPTVEGADIPEEIPEILRQWENWLENPDDG